MTNIWAGFPSKEKMISTLSHDALRQLVGYGRNRSLEALKNEVASAIARGLLAERDLRNSYLAETAR